jgi:hypothetical protein
MKDKKSYPFPLIICVIVISNGLFKQFDSENLSFEKPWLALVYVITILIASYAIIKDN